MTLGGSACAPSSVQSAMPPRFVHESAHDAGPMFARVSWARLGTVVPPVLLSGAYALQPPAAKPRCGVWEAVTKTATNPPARTMATKARLICASCDRQRDPSIGRVTEGHSGTLAQASAIGPAKPIWPSKGLWLSLLFRGSR